MVKRYKGAFAQNYKSLSKKLSEGIITESEYKSKIRQINKYKNTMTSTQKLLRQQKKLGNLSIEGEELLKNTNNLKKLVINSYQLDPADKLRTRNIVEEFTNAGRIVTQGTDRKGNKYLKMGVGLRNAYKFKKAAIDKFGLDPTYQTTTTLITGRDAQGNPIFEDVTFNYDFTSEESFIRSLKGQASVIALRIAVGENRDEVLDDYGY